MTVFIRRVLLVSAILLSLQSLAEVSSAAVVYPNTFGGTSQQVNVIRRYDNGLPLYSVAQSGSSGTVSGGSPAAVVDGGHTTSQWNGVNSPDDSATIQITLDQSYSLRTFRQVYEVGGNYLPSTYDISVSNTGFGSLVSVASGGVPGVTQVNTLASPVTAKYIQYSWTGQGGPQPFVLLREFQAFADATSGLQSNGGWNAARIPATVSPVTANWLDSVSNIVDGNVQDSSYLRGTGAGGDAIALMDLGSLHMIESLGLGFYSGQAWGSGMKIELSRDNVTYSTVYDVNTSVTQSQVNIADMSARYIRITDKNSSTGALSEFEVFTDALPTLASSPLTGSTINVGAATAFETVTLANAFTLTNVGEATSDLQVLSYSITGLDAAIFDVPDFLPTTLTVGGTASVQFDISATLGAVGVYNNAVLTIHTNVGDISYNLLATALPVPEPSTFLLLGLGGLGLIRQARRRQAEKA
jgi:hypothetical protein